MTPYRRRAAKHSDERSGHDSNHDETRIEEHQLEKALVNGAVCDPREKERQQTADDSFYESVDQEWRANESVSRADEAHDRNLSRPRENRNANGRADDD